MKFDQIAPFMRFICYGKASKLNYGEMIGYECRLFYIAEGSGKLGIRNKIHILKKGDMVIINSGVPYKILFDQWKVTYYMIKFDCTQEHTDIDTDNAGASPDEFDPQKILSHMDFEDAPQFDDYFILQNMNRSEKILRNIYSENRKKLIGWRAIANGLLTEVLGECLREKTGYSETAKLRDVINYIHFSYDTHLTNSQIAKKFGYHPYYLSTLFLKATGKTMHQYLLSLRMARAAELLTTDDIPISRVAEMCGFENGSKFSATFKKEFGISPSQFRKNSRWQS